MQSDLIVVGLTGGIASGKSTVASFLREAGMPVIDADQLARTVLDPDTDAYRKVIATFGDGILNPEGEIDRQKLGAHVFDNPSARAKLEAITHPAIADTARQAFALVSARGEPMAIYEAALLVETGIYKGLASLAVASCSVKSQLARLKARDGLTDAAAAARIAAQYPLEEKLKVADHVIDTECTLEETRQRTLHVLAALKNRFLNN